VASEYELAIPITMISCGHLNGTEFVLQITGKYICVSLGFQNFPVEACPLPSLLSKLGKTFWALHCFCPLVMV